MDTFVAIADSTRRQMLDLLRSGERAAGDLVDAFPQQTQPGISRHLRMLRETGLVNVRRKEQRRVYSLRTEGFAELDAWLSRYRPSWEQKLDALEHRLEKHVSEARRPTKKKKPKR